MANFTLQNMTPGNAADCYLPGCNGVVGGLCVGALPTGANVNQTLWWCCTPYAEYASPYLAFPAPITPQLHTLLQY